MIPGASIAGPPLVTDDTGTAGAGTLEIIAFAAGESRNAGDSMQAPALDLAYGINEVLEFGVVIPRQRVKNTGERSVTAWGQASVGLKWRFYNRGGRALTLAPSLSMPLSTRSTELGIVDDTYIFTLPLLASISSESWEWTANLGYSISSQTFDAINAGASARYRLSPSVRVMAELWGVDFIEDGANTGFLNWRAGVEWTATRRLTVLGAFGGGVWSQLDAANELQSDFYFGLQYVVGGNR